MFWFVDSFAAQNTATGCYTIFCYNLGPLSVNLSNYHPDHFPKIVMIAALDLLAMRGSLCPDASRIS